jgi:hypothetical protein
MWHKNIQATSSWRKGQAHYDTVLVNTNPEVGGVCGFEVACVFLLFYFWHENKEYPCALHLFNGIHMWASNLMRTQHCHTGLWMVKPDIDDSGDPRLAIIHLNSIY